MSKMYKTPGVYIEEKNAFPGSVIAVETATPVFIGYTEKAERNGKSLISIPTRIASFAEYAEIFGHGYKHKFGLLNAATITDPPEFFYFYNSIRLFYENGGSNCYIMSLGTYGGNKPAVTAINLDDFSDEIFQILAKEQEPALIVLPDVISKFRTKTIECYQLYTKVLEHCHITQCRFAILDVNCSNNMEDDIKIFRKNLRNSFLNYGAAYYPWLETSVVPASEIDFSNLSITTGELKNVLPADEVEEIFNSWEQRIAANEKLADGKEKEAGTTALNTELHQSLLSVCSVYKQIMDEIKNRLCLLPPSAAIAGIYCLTDNSRGVWKSPANVSLSSVNGPSVTITHEEQELMNIDLTGISINAIRPFPGIGTLVWGARTLDSNSLDWRYINVRRTMIMIEQSLKLAILAYVFEPNNSATWESIRSMMNNFLFNLWKQGALAGSVPEAAYDVQAGLGSSMTPTDILDGFLRVTVKVAIVRPAEFIVITFQQLQQPS